MIIVDKVTFKYGRLTVLNNISIRFEQGLHLIKGPNGSGKTTLCKIISGLLPPTDGKVLIEGKDIYGENADQILNKVIFVHDKPIILNKSVYENLILGLKLRNSYLALDKVELLAEKFNLNGILDKKAAELSMGYKQLITILRAFAVEPKYLVLDEPFSNLDEEYREKVVTLIKEFSEKNTVIVATHTNYLDDLTDSSFYIKNGGILKK